VAGVGLPLGVRIWNNCQRFPSLDGSFPGSLDLGNPLSRCLVALPLSTLSRPVGHGRPTTLVLVLDGATPRSSGRQKTRTNVVRRPSTALRLQPLVGRSGTTSSLLLFLYIFPFPFSFLTLTYLSTSICLIDQFCASVVDGRRRPSTPSRTAPRQSLPSKEEAVSSFVVLTPSWTDGTTEFAASSILKSREIRPLALDRFSLTS